MKVIVIYDSIYGNTKKIAEAISEAVIPPDTVDILHTSKSNLSQLDGIDLLIIGSPTHGGRPSEGMQKFLSKIPANFLNNTDSAVFDTRFSYKDQNFGLRMLMKAIGYAAEKEAKILVGMGGHLVVSPEGFIVQGKEGPLKEGEIERAIEWGKHLIRTVVERRIIHPREVSGEK